MASCGLIIEWDVFLYLALPHSLAVFGSQNTAEFVSVLKVPTLNCWELSGSGKITAGMEGVASACHQCPGPVHRGDKSKYQHGICSVYYAKW